MQEAYLRAFKFFIGWNVLRNVTPAMTSNDLTQQILSSHLRSLNSQERLVDVTSTDQHTVKPWFDGRGLNYSPLVIGLTQQGYALVGGRVDYVDNRYVAVIVYKHGGHPDHLVRDEAAR